MAKSEWIWMPHAGHLCVGSQCRFRLNTYVNGYIVSTVGEYWPSRESLIISAQIEKQFCDFSQTERSKKIKEFDLSLKGDNFEREYLKTFGYQTIGGGEFDLYETMVFVAQKMDESCCPYQMKSGSDLECERYFMAGEAYSGHIKMCEKYDVLTPPSD